MAPDLPTYDLPDHPRPQVHVSPEVSAILQDPNAISYRQGIGRYEIDWQRFDAQVRIERATQIWKSRRR